LDHQHDAGAGWLVFTQNQMNQNMSSLDGALVLIVGLGETGLAAAQWCARQGARLRIADTRAEPAGMEQLKASLGTDCTVEWHLGCDVFADSLLEDASCLVISPGLSPLLSPVKELLASANAMGIEVIGEIELFARALIWLKEQRGYAPTLLGVTGTNGKTTVTAMTRHMLAESGCKVRAAGNISPAAIKALMDALDQDDLPAVWVLELSSFQLVTTNSLRFAAAVVMNVTQDHLDWHLGMEDYAQAKSRIFQMSDICIVNRDDPLVVGMVPALTDVNVRSFGKAMPLLAGDFGIEPSHDVKWLVSAEPAEFDDEAPAATGRRKKDAPKPERKPGRVVRLMPVDALAVKGLHNALNCEAALMLARAAGGKLADLLRAVRDYVGEPHRMAFVRSVKGVDFYNDSKGTNVGATVAGLEGLGRPVVLVAGGVGKGQDFTPLVPVVRMHARAVVLIGQDAPIILDTLVPSGVNCVMARDMRDAVRQAFELATEGHAVLLSPACASFDMFKNYPHRGQVFVDEVNELALDQGEIL
jgi:UDP-N-acetylmuramoylalanine--D-glutamate ligase